MNFSIEPDQGQGPRRRIVRVEPIKNTRTGNRVTFDCGHQVQTFGKIDPAGTYRCLACQGKQGATFGKES